MLLTPLRWVTAVCVAGCACAQGIVVGPTLPPLAGAVACGDVDADGFDDRAVYDSVAAVPTIPVSPGLLGASLSLQAVVIDPLANVLGLVTSNALDVTTAN